MQPLDLQGRQFLAAEHVAALAGAARLDDVRRLTVRRRLGRKLVALGLRLAPESPAPAPAWPGASRAM